MLGMPTLDATQPETHFLCSIIAGLVAAIITNPVDVIKTRKISMQSTVNVPDAPQYGGLLHSIGHIFRYEGIRGFMKGFGPTAMRLVPHNIILWQVQERVLLELARYEGETEF